MEILVFVVWLALCGAAAYIADNKGRSGVGIFFLSFFLSPLVGIIVALGMRPDDKKVASAQGKKKCPNCAEFVQPDAKTCRFCQYSFVEDEAAERARLEVQAEEESAAAARRQAEYEAYQAAEAAKPWLRRHGVELGIAAALIVFIGGVMWLAATHPAQSVPASESKPATPTWVTQERTKVPKSVWDKKVAWAVRHSCYFAAMSRDEIVQALGKPSEEQPSSLTFNRQTNDCVRYETGGDTCVEYKSDKSIIFLKDGYTDPELNPSQYGCRTLNGEHEYSGFEVPNFNLPKEKTRKTRDSAEAERTQEEASSWKTQGTCEAHGFHWKEGAPDQEPGCWLH